MKTRLINKQFGNLLVKNFYECDKNRSILWLCECQCEKKTTVIVSSHDLTSGTKDNCGCLTNIKQSIAKKKYNTYDLTGDFGVGYTLKGEEFYFDLEDYNKIKDYCWFTNDGYFMARSLNNNFITRIHRIIMNVSDPEIKVDHIFHKKNDNRKSELRICSNAENCVNRIINKNNTSGKSGVHFRSDNNKWRARIWENGKCHSIGQFNTFEDAMLARDKAEIQYFKEFRYEEGII